MKFFGSENDVGVFFAEGFATANRHDRFFAHILRAVENGRKTLIHISMRMIGNIHILRLLECKRKSSKLNWTGNKLSIYGFSKHFSAEIFFKVGRTYFYSWSFVSFQLFISIIWASLLKIFDNQINRNNNTILLF